MGINTRLLNYTKNQENYLFSTNTSIKILKKNGACPRQRG